MLVVFWFLLVLVFSCLILLMPFLWGRSIYQRYAGSRAVTCPQNRQPVAVSFDAWHAALTGLGGRTELRLSNCTRWPERIDCGQDCILEASHRAAFTIGEVAPPKAKKIRHLPVLLAAFAAWYSGMIWHSEYLFRERWTQAVGLDQFPSRQVSLSLAPHLLSVAICLLFAYGVAWLLACTGKKGVGRGMIVSVFLWGALALTSLAAAGIENISADLLRIEVPYTFLASLIVGAIQGAFAGRSSLTASSRLPQKA